jgi:hypothetical protein
MQTHISLYMFKKLLPLCLIALGSVTAYAADLVIAENGKCDYQIVIPDKGRDAIVDINTAPKYHQKVLT